MCCWESDEAYRNLVVMFMFCCFGDVVFERFDGNCTEGLWRYFDGLFNNGFGEESTDKTFCTCECDCSIENLEFHSKTTLEKLMNFSTEFLKVCLN
jgi:hypothetical protein